MKILGKTLMLVFEVTEELQKIKREALINATGDNTEIKVPLVTKNIGFGYLVAYPDGRYDKSGNQGGDTDLVVKPFGLRRRGIVARIHQFCPEPASWHPIRGAIWGQDWYH